MPSPPATPRKSRPHAAAARAPVAVAASVAVSRANGSQRRDLCTEARETRTREYMRAENEREAALADQGYWF